MTDPHLLPIADELDFARAHRPRLGEFSRLRWTFFCLAGLRHRAGESWFLVRQGLPPQPISRCTRCGLRIPGKVAL